MKFAVVILACVVVAAQAQFGQFNRASAYAGFGTGPQRQQQQTRPQQIRPQQPFRAQQVLRPVQAVAKSPVAVAITPVPRPAAVAPVVSAPVRNVAVAAQAIASRSGAGTANVLKYGNEVNPDGSFNYFFETDNGIAAQAQGSPRTFPGNPPVSPSVSQGSYSWTSPEGEQIVITYVADENGFQPQGNAIPTPPPIPPQIARSLEYIARINGGGARQ